MSTVGSCSGLCVGQDLECRVYNLEEGTRQTKSVLKVNSWTLWWFFIALAGVFLLVILK